VGEGGARCNWWFGNGKREEEVMENVAGKKRRE